VVFEVLMVLGVHLVGAVGITAALWPYLKEEW
jgi:hypothetical protein